MKGLIAMKDIKNFNEISSYGDNQWYRTPNGLCFCINRVNNNIYGNPAYHLYFDDFDQLRKIKAVKSSNRIGRLYYDKGYLYFNSYNVGHDLEHLFKKCNIETDLSPHEFL